MPKISICIPIHDTPDTAFFLSRLLNSVSSQSFRDFEVVITKEGAFARNHNAAITKAKGEYIQMMQMDDYFAHSHALQNIIDGFSEKTYWQITSCLHEIEGEICSPHIPEWTENIYTGNNRLGSVSSLSFRRDKALLFEEPLTWVVDCDLYYRLFLKYGIPNILKTQNIIVTERPDRLSNTLSDELKAKEVEYLIKKYGK